MTKKMSRRDVIKKSVKAGLVIGGVAGGNNRGRFHLIDSIS